MRFYITAFTSYLRDPLSLLEGNKMCACQSKVCIVLKILERILIVVLCGKDFVHWQLMFMVTHPGTLVANGMVTLSQIRPGRQGCL